MTISTFSDLFGCMITYKEARNRICKDYEAEAIYNTFPKDIQRNIAAFVSGECSIPMTYDPFFDFCLGGQENIEYSQILLSDLIGEKLTIVNTLPSSRSITDKINYYSLKYIVKFASGQMADVEFQKISIMPPQNMIECLIADNILKQYNRLKQIKGASFRFESMWPSYLIILTEKSLIDSDYTHASTPGVYYIDSEYNFFKSDINKEGLSHVCIISLEDYINNKSKKVSNLDAWMTFISSTNARDCMQLASIFPHFEELYKKVSSLREDTSTLIKLYHEGQRLRDHNSLVLASYHNIKETIGLKRHIEELKSGLQGRSPRIYHV